MKANPVGWFEIYVNDIERAKKFYKAVLGAEFTKLSQDENFELWAFPTDTEAYGSGGALVKMTGFEAGANSVIVYFSSDDCSVEEKRIVAAGGKVQKSKTPIGQYGFIALGFDTEGNIFGLHSMK